MNALFYAQEILDEWQGCPKRRCELCNRLISERECRRGLGRQRWDTYRLCDGCVEREMDACFHRYDGAFDLHDGVRRESSLAMPWNAEIQARRHAARARLIYLR